MRKFVIVTANEQDSLDVSVSFEEHENLEEAYEANGLTSQGEKGYGIAFCEYAEDHVEGEDFCDHCKKDEYYSDHDVTIVMEVPPMGVNGGASYFTNG